MTTKQELEWTQLVDEGEYAAAEALQRKAGQDMSATAFTATSQLNTEAIIIQPIN